VCGLAILKPAISDLGVEQESARTEVITTTEEWTEGANPSGAPTTVTTETATTTEDPYASLLDRLVSTPVVVLLQVGVALLAAFIVGGVTQHFFLGRFGFSLGPLIFPEVTEGQVASAGRSVISGLELVIPDHRDAKEQAEPPSVPSLPQADPNLQLVGLRIEIEQRLNQLAQAHRVELEGAPRPTPRRLVQRLVATGVLPQSVASPLLDLIGLGNQAAHGVEVSDGAGEWAQREGPRLLEALDALARSRKPR